MKQTFFAKLMVVALMATMGCSSEGGSGQRDATGGQFIGTWQKGEASCPTCSQWIISKTKEDGLMAEFFDSSGEKESFATSYDPATKMLNIEIGIGAKAAIVNGDLKIRSLTYHKRGTDTQEPVQ